MPTLNRTVQYAGLITLPIRVFTTTYPAKKGVWQFSPGSPIPMEFLGFTKNSRLLGLYARVIDLNTGYTTLSVGDVNNADENTALFTYPLWDRNTLFGFAYNDILTLRPAAFSYPLRVDGGTHVFPTFTANASIPLPHVNNTGAPQSGNAPNNITPGRAASGSAIIDLVETNYVSIGGGISPVQGFDFGISNQHFILQASMLAATNGIPSGVLSWVLSSNPSNPHDRQQLVNTDFATFAQNYNVAFVNPGAGADIDDIMTQHGNVGRTHPTQAGFLCICKDVIVVDGKTINGFGVLIAPDYNSYQIVALPPSDAGTANWWAGVGEWEARIDMSGALIMKNANADTTLFISSGNVLRVLPLFFPVPIPDRPESDAMPSMMRSFQQ